MKLGYFVKMLNPELVVILKDADCNAIYFEGKISEIIENNYGETTTVKDWNFGAKIPTIYVNIA